MRQSLILFDTGPVLQSHHLRPSSQLMHANSGVEKGMAAGGKPVEIMGMMLGRPDTETPNALIVTDVSVCVCYMRYSCTSTNATARTLLVLSVLENLLLSDDDWRSGSPMLL